MTVNIAERVFGVKLYDIKSSVQKQETLRITELSISFKKAEIIKYPQRKQEMKLPEIEGELELTVVVKMRLSHV